MRIFQQISDNLSEKPALLGALLVLFSLLLYMPTAHHEFLVYDDSAYVTENAHVISGISVSNIFWAFTNFNLFYHPITWLSHMVDCQLFGLNPGAHHLVNVLLHAINVLLLFFLLQRSTGAIWRSFAVAGLFALHPMNVETVAWVAERKSLLSTLFSFLTIAAYGWYVQHPELKRYLIVVLTFSLALMSKSMAVTLPIVLLLLDYWPLRRKAEGQSWRCWKGLLIEKLPLFLLSVAFSLLTWFGQRIEGAVVSLSELPLHMRLENAVTAYVAFLAKLIWPAKLAVFYPHPASKLPPGAHLPFFQVIACVAVLAGVSFLVLRLPHKRYLVVGWFGFLVTMFPVIGVVQVGLHAMADRYAYVPYIGLFIIAVWLFGDLSVAPSRPWLAPAFAAIGACVLLVFALSASQYLAYWQNGVSLMEHTRAVAGAPDAEIESLLADAYYSSGQPGNALPHYRAWCELAPSHDLCHYNLAQVLFQQGELREALTQYQMAQSLTHDPGMATACAQKTRQVLSVLGTFR